MRNSRFNREGRGQPLFGDDGKPSPYVDNILKFLQEYQTQFRRTQSFCKRVQDLDLLEPMQAQAELPSGERFSLGGFMAVNRSKLKAVSGDKLAELAKADELELIYLHLQSMRNFTALKDRLAGTGPDRQTDAALGSQDGGTADTKESGAKAKIGGSRMRRAASE
jgi:SapC